MAGDLDITEVAVLDAAAGEYPLHRYGRLGIVASDGQAAPDFADPDVDPVARADELGEIERLGLAALHLRESHAFRDAKRKRPRDGEEWDMPECTTVVPEPSSIRPRARAGPTSAYLEGSVAVGVVIVQGPGDALTFSDAERTKVVAEVQNGLSWLAATNPAASVSFSYDIRNVTLTVAADPTAADLEGHWRNPAMQALGFSGDWDGVLDYVEDIRTDLGTRWTYCAFFTKYPLRHFAYASIGGPRVVMEYANDGWGPDNIDRVFAHETGHIFGAPDEYASSGCNCGGAWGRFAAKNGNCANCAPGGGVKCLMSGNDFEVCGFTPSHLGWRWPQLVVPSFGYVAGGWRVHMHPRFMADITGDGRADVVGFGNAGVYVALAQTDATFGEVRFALGNYGYDAGWRVNNHVRLLADLTGDGRADLVGFGFSGVSTALSQGDGTFGEQRLVLSTYGLSAAGGGWWPNRHPRLMADVTGDGRADIVGFGNAGVYVSLSRGDGTFDEPRLGVENFGYNAGWRVADHPRLLADVTGDGRADIVGFGNAGVYVSLSRGDGTFDPPQLVIDTFGYDAGGWRVRRHPRFLADITGDGRADIVGFGEAGVYVSRSLGGGSFAPLQFALADFGAGAGGWDVNRHPRLLADMTGDGRTDIVGFGYAGAYESFARGDGTFEPPRLAVSSFGYDIGSWRVGMHPRFLADTAGDRRPEIMGFGDAGLYVARS